VSSAAKSRFRFHSLDGRFKRQKIVVRANPYSLISPSELALRDVTLSQPLSNSLGAWEIKGVVKNNSPRTLTGLWLKVTVRDCPNAALCATIGEAIRHIVINVPPSQTQIIDEGNLFPREMFIPEKLEWSYEIVQAIVQAD
jgi:hypothetical protein